MSNLIQQTILNKLLDKYEKSVSFIGKNKHQQSFRERIIKLFPKYEDISDFHTFEQVNNAIEELVRLEYISTTKTPANLYEEVELNVIHIEEIYLYLNRTNKRTMHEQLAKLLYRYKDKNIVLQQYCENQLIAIKKNKSVKYFKGNINEYEHLLKALAEVFLVKEETFIREFSIKIFGDSKTFDKIASNVESILLEYGDYPDEENVLAYVNLVKLPSYVFFKGKGKLIINGQVIDCSNFNADIGISMNMIKQIDTIEITGESLITIENLTTFHRYNAPNQFVIYLGGYHNEVRRELLKLMAQQNNMKQFYHFGDIDAGGLYILEHLKRRTGIAFKAYKMDKETLIKYKRYAKPLTDNDKKRLLKLKEQYINYEEVVNYMLENNIKLEQEAIQE